MKLIKNKHLPSEKQTVKCSFCGKQTDRKLQGHPYGGRTCYRKCFESFEQKPIDYSCSIGEESAYNLYKI